MRHSTQTTDLSQLFVLDYNFNRKQEVGSGVLDLNTIVTLLLVILNTKLFRKSVIDVNDR